MDYEDPLLITPAGQSSGAACGCLSNRNHVQHYRSKSSPCCGQGNSCAWICWLTITDNGTNTLRSGETLEQAIEQLLPLGPAGLMINCSMPEAVSAAMGQLKDLPFLLVVTQTDLPQLMRCDLAERLLV